MSGATPAAAAPPPTAAERQPPPTLSGLLSTLGQQTCDSQAPRACHPFTLTGLLRGQPVHVLVDSGATSDFVSASWLAQHGLEYATKKGSLRLANGQQVSTPGYVSQAHLIFGAYQTHRPLLVTDLHTTYDVILGQPWLREASASIDWAAGRMVVMTPAGQQHTLMSCRKHLPCGVCLDSVSSFAKNVQPDDQLYVVIVKPTEPRDPQDTTDNVEATGPTGNQGQAPGTDHPLATPILREFADVFPASLPPGMPPTRGHPFNIDLEPGHTPPCPQMIRLNPAHMELLRTTLDTLLADGRIEPSTSPYGAPVFFVGKKDGTARMVIDYRALNKITKKNKYPIPRIDDLMDSLGGASCFSSLDLISGYHQIPVSPADRFKTAFRTRFGSYEFNVLPFGLTNAPSNFMALMETVLRPYLYKFALVYLDDILIYSKTPEEHVLHLQQVLDALRKAKLYAKLSKCSFFQSSISWLGHVISGSGISLDPIKVAAVAAWTAPRTVKQLQSFLGFANFYRRFIAGFGQLAAPLTDLLTGAPKGTTPLQWTTVHQTTFEDLKKALTTAPLLQPYDPQLPIRVTTDASDTGIGAELSQLHDKQWLPVAYLSRRHSSAERNYTTHDKELLAVVRALRAWDHYLGGRHFTVLTDHRPLRFLRTQPNLGARQQRWLEELEKYDYTIEYLPGKNNVVADALSRQEPTLATLSHSSSDISSPLTERIRAAYAEDQAIQDLINMLSGPTPPEDLQLTLNKDGLLLDLSSGDPRYYIPDNAELKTTLLYEAHDTAGHYGSTKTLELLRRHFIWPGMAETVSNYVASCDPCQRYKAVNARPFGELQPLPVPPYKWHTVSMDFMKLPRTSTGFDGVFVFVDKLSKQVHYAPASACTSAAQVARIFFDTVYRHHGLPEVLISDRDSRFTSAFWRSLWGLCGSKLSMSTAFHPQTDGQTERANRTLLESLRSFVAMHQSDWDQHLTAAEFAYNNSVNASTGFSPFYLAHGHHPRDVLAAAGPPAASDDLSAEPSLPADALAVKFVDTIQTAQTSARQALEQAQAQQKRHADKRRRPVGDVFQVGTQVMLSTSNLRRYQQAAHQGETPSTKLGARYIGPFTIVRQVNPVSFTLDLPDEYGALHRTFHVSLLKPYVANDGTKYPGRTAPPAPPAPVEIHPDGFDDHYTVEDIVAKRYVVSSTKRGRGKPRPEWQVQWQGYSEMTWEPKSHITRSEELKRMFAAFERDWAARGTPTPTVVIPR